jgi:hypothetical protein
MQAHRQAGRATFAIVAICACHLSSDVPYPAAAGQDWSAAPQHYILLCGELPGQGQIQGYYCLLADIATKFLMSESINESVAPSLH